MEPKVSFITAVKNRAKELEEMLPSLISQDMPEWEAIIVDDHSEEPIKEAVEKFQDERIHYFRLPDNQTGISHGRNYAIQQAHSNIMIIADGDDINEPNRARVTYEEMTKNNYDVFYGGIRDFSEKGKTDRLLQPFNAELLPMFNYLTNASSAFRRDKFIQLGKFDPEFVVCEDFDLYLRFLNAKCKFGYTEEVIVNYRVSPTSTSATKFTLLHEYFMKARIKNKIPPFQIEEVKKYALPYFAEKLVTSWRALYKDDRVEK
jgi:glycosyltransferase involved in cell wall biosynthesis